MRRRQRESAAVERRRGGTCLLGRLLVAGPQDDGVGSIGTGPLHLPLVQGVALLPEDLAAQDGAAGPRREALRGPRRASCGLPGFSALLVLIRGGGKHAEHCKGMPAKWPLHT